MLEEIPLEKVKADEELVAGGDLRAKGNAWLRAAWSKSGIKKVPRETQFRCAVKALHLGVHLIELPSDPRSSEFRSFPEARAWRQLRRVSGFASRRILCLTATLS